MTSLNNVHLDKEQVINICDDLLFEVENSKPNKEEEILSGKIDARKYDSVKELIDDLEKDV